MAQSRFHVELKSIFVLKNNFMGFLLGQITLWMNFLYESRMKCTWCHSTLSVEEVSFFRRLEVVLFQLHICTLWSSRHFGLGCRVPLLHMPDIPGNKSDSGVFYTICCEIERKYLAYFVVWWDHTTKQAKYFRSISQQMVPASNWLVILCQRSNRWLSARKT